MAEQGLILDIDTQFIERLKKADQSLGSMIHNADKLTESLKKAFNSVNGSNIDLISRMATQWEALGNQKLRLDVDTSKVEKLTSLLDDTVKTMQAFSSNGIELFDTDKVYDNTKSIFELNKELSAVEKKITELKAAWDGDIFEPPINEKTKKPWSRGSKAYKAAREAWESDKDGRVDKEEVAAELALLAEKKAILQEELRWANMTQDERAEYVKKKLKEELNAEQKHNNSIIAEYRKTVNEMLGIMRETDRLSKKDDSGVINPEIQQLNVRFAQLNQERIAMEQNYGNIIVEVAEEANAKAVKIYAERKLTEERLRKDAEEKEWQAYLSTPEGALQLASDAKTINEMKEAQKYLQIARGNVDSTKDRGLVDELNNAYTRLRITIEDLTTAEKNEHALQPSVRNEYIRLLRELEKVQEARNRLSETESFVNADPQAYDNYNNLLRRERDIQDKLNSIRTNSIVESEGKRINLLEETDRAYLAEKAQRELSETERIEREKLEKIRASYKEVLDELRKIQHEQERIEDAETKYGVDFDSTNAFFGLEKRQQELNDKRILLETHHQEKISDIQENERKRRLKDEVDAAERAAIQAIEARKKAEKDKEEHRGTYRGAMEYSKNTKSIQEQIQAIKYLKQARESLKRTDFSSEKKYRKALNELTLEIDRQTDSIKELNLESKKTNAISGQLKTSITNMVGIGAIKGYVTQLIRIRGEFELQNKSLQVLLRNKDEANRLWAQTVDLAVKSPYRVDQLVTATKQLAAYRVETVKLHSTTRMLADLSSGLGVEIDRLILAFGQVKAANFLRGTELRQFSEAGINILDELAARYTELEGRIVSVGDVFDRVSKRMVSFADVEAVLQDMTGEGGQFYKMQEQQAETLRGMTMNLKDSIMLMYNDIGEATDGVLKSTMTFFKYMVDNWKSYANIITTVVGALAGYKAVMIASRLVTSLWSSVANIAAATTVKLGGSATWAAARVRLLNRAMSVNPILRFISITTALAGAIFGLDMSFDKAGEGAKSQLQILEENAIKAKNAAAGIKELTDERNELLKVENRSEEQEKRLNDITSARTRLLGELTTANAEYAKSLKLAGDNSEEMAKAIEEGNAKIKSQLALAYDLEKINWEEISEAQSVQSTKIGAEAKYSVVDKSKLQRNAIGPGTSQDWIQVLDEVQDLIKSGAELSEVVEGLKASTKKAGFNYERRKGKIISMLRELFDEEGIGDIIADYIEADTVVDEAFNSLGQKIADSVSDFSKGSYGRILAEGLSSGIDETKNDALKKLQDYWKYIFTSKNIPESAQELFTRQIAKIFNLEDGWFTKQISKELSAWQKGYNALLDVLTKGRKIPSLTPVNATTSIEDQVKALNRFKETQEAIIKQYDDQQKIPGMLPIHSKEDADNARYYLDVIEHLLEALGSGKSSRKSELDKSITNRIRLIKELNSEYQRLRKSMSATEAESEVKKAYADTFAKVFEGEGMSLTKLVFSEEKLEELKEESAKAGRVISDEMSAAMEEIASNGVYIRNFSDELVEFIKKHEGFRAEVYKDVVGVKTQGYGETVDIEEGVSWSKEKAEMVLRNSLTERYVVTVNKILDANKDLVLTQEQYNALLDVAYHGGGGALKTLISNVRDVEKGVKYIERISGKIEKTLGKDAAARFGDEFIKSFREAETIYDRIALMLQVTNLTAGGNITTWYNGMQKLADWRSEMFSGSKDFNDILINTLEEVKSFDFTSLEGVIGKLKELEPIAKEAGEDAERELSNAISAIEVLVNIKLHEDQLENVVRQVEDMFSGYELSIELDKLQVPKEFAKDFFNVDPISFEDLKKQILSLKPKFHEHGTEGEKEYQAFLDKLDEMETKSQQERLKKYLQYTRNAIGERGKILMEESLQLTEIAKTFQLTDTFAISKGLVSKEQLDAIRELGYTVSSLMERSDEDILTRNLGITAEQLSALREYIKLLKEREAIAVEGVKRETRQKLDKFDFEQFKGSEVFQELYSDLSNAPTAALDSLIKKLEAHKDQWNELPIDQVKEYVKLLKDAKEALDSNKMPRELIAEQLAVINNSKYGNIGDASKAMVDAEERIEQLEREKSIVEKIANMRAQGINDLDIIKTLQGDQIPLMSRTTDYIDSEIDGQKTLIADAQAFLNAITLITNAYKKQIENINKVKTVVDKVFNGWESINSLFDDGSMSAELSGMFQTLSDAGFEMKEMVSNTKSAITNLQKAEEGATKFGFALDTASGIVGIIVAAVKVVVDLFNYFSEKRNNQINADIEANMRDVEKLQHAYENLERQIDDAFTSDSISSLTGELNKNLEAQKREIEDNISLEEDKKDKDKDQEKIDEWNRQLEDIERQQAENIEKMFSTLTDGVLDNVLDATRGFVDAWYDAYDETGDGMKGLEKNFKEMFANILKQQASLTLISPFIDDFKSQLEGYMNDSRLTANEATALRTKWGEIAPQMNEALEQYFDSFSDVLDTDYGELSDLEKGIQGMTEDQAEVLASYWNSCRFMLSNIDTTLTRLANATLNTDEASNPVVSALKEQTELIRTIRNMFNSVIDQGSSPHSGAYLKVYMP